MKIAIVGTFGLLSGCQAGKFAVELWIQNLNYDTLCIDHIKWPISFGPYDKLSFNTSLIRILDLNLFEETRRIQNVHHVR